MLLLPLGTLWLLISCGRIRDRRLLVLVLDVDGIIIVIIRSARMVVMDSCLDEESSANNPVAGWHLEGHPHVQLGS
jgi:hypothetical protein